MRVDTHLSLDCTAVERLYLCIGMPILHFNSMRGTILHEDLFAVTTLKDYIISLSHRYGMILVRAKWIVDLDGSRRSFLNYARLSCC